MSLLEIDGLSVEFDSRGRTVRAVDAVSMSVERGEVLAIVGESGSGKSTIGRAVVGTIDVVGGRITAGEIRLDNTDVLRLPAREQRSLRGRRIALVPQDPLSALNPLQRVVDQVAEPMRIHERASRRAARTAAFELLRRVGIPDPQRIGREYPHRLSGGQRQRAMIAMAISLSPDVIVADEPTTALDATVQAEVLELLVDLKRELGTTLLLISHDLGLVESIADTVVVMYAGRIAESGKARGLYAHPRHPYTSALLAAVPQLDVEVSPVQPIGGQPPRLTDLPSGCAFHPRCVRAVERCTSDTPTLRAIDDRFVACHVPLAQ